MLQHDVSIRAFWLSRIRMAALMLAATIIHSCTGSVSNLASGMAGASGIAIVTTELNGIMVGDVSTGISTVGGTAPLKFEVTSGALPPGLTIDEKTGAITGNIPVSALDKTYGVSITVTDSANLSAMKTYSGSIAGGDSVLVIGTTTLSDFIAGISYSYPLVVLGGSKPLKYEIGSGSLPTGVSLNSKTGVLSGTPAANSAGQAFAFVLKVSDAEGQVRTSTFLGTVKASIASSFAIITSAIPTPTAGSAYGASIAVTGGTGPYSYAISSGVLPSGLSINDKSGLISGTVRHSAQGAPYLFSVRATDATGLVSTVSFSGFVNSYQTVMGPAALPGARPGEAYNINLYSTGGQATYTYSLVSGSLPTGLNLDASGVISGTVSESESGLSKTFTIKSRDMNGIEVSSTYTIATSAFPLTITTTTLTNAIESAPYSNNSTPIGVSGGTPPYTFEYSGSLPTGVALTNVGAFIGSPMIGTGSLLTGTQYTIYIRARDVLNRVSAKIPLTLTVVVGSPVVDSIQPPTAVLAENYNHAITASGGRPPYIFSITAGSSNLPNGITISNSGVLSGLVTGSATCPANNFTVKVTDALNQTSASSVKCIVTMSGVAVNSRSFPPVIIGSLYDQMATAIGGTKPYTFTAASLPIGLSINPQTGRIFGYTNATAGEYTGFITVKDSSNPPLTDDLQVNFKVRDTLTLSDAVLPRGATGRSYNNGSGFQLVASGGETPYNFSIVSGALPAGLTLSQSGLIQGSPALTAASYGGSYSFSVQVSDSSGQTTAAKALSLNVSIPPKIGETNMPIAVKGTAYAYDIVRVGGSNEFNGASIATRLNYDVSVKTPAGLTLSDLGLSYSTTTGRIFGTPSSVGDFELAVSVTDQHGLTGSDTLKLKINSKGKTFDLKTPRFSDPCLANGVNNHTCSMSAYDVDTLTNTSQQFLAYVRNETWPVSVQIAKIDETGRVQRASGDVTSINVPLHGGFSQSNLMGVGNWPPFLKIADMDRDGRKDIVMVDRTPNQGQICILWNTNMPDNMYGMPQGFSNSNFNCYPVPNLLGAPGWVQLALEIKIREDLRPDATNYGSRDIILTSQTNNNNLNSTYILKNDCGAHASKASGCLPENRPKLFEGYGFLRTTVASQAAGVSTLTIDTTVTGAITLTASPNGLVGMPISGPGIPAGTYITATTTSSISLSRVTTAALSSADLTTIVGAYIPSVVATAGNSVITAANASPSWIGRQICVVNTGNGQCQPQSTGVPLTFPLPISTRVIAVSGTQVTLSNSPSFTATINLTVFGPTIVWPYISTRNEVLRDANISAIGWFATPKPNFAGGARATSVNDCPSIAVAGNTPSGLGFVYVVKQRYTSSNVCDGNFLDHNIADEWQPLPGVTWPNPYILAEDFNNDGITDMAVSASNLGNTGFISAAAVRVYMPSGNPNIFQSGNALTAQLQSRSNIQVGASRLAAYCLDGSSSCSYPSLVATCSTYGCMSIFPNQCTVSGCTTPFEGTTPSLRIDYPAPTGNSDIIIRPIVSTGTVVATANLVDDSDKVTVDSASYGKISVGQTVVGNGIPSFSYVKQKGPTPNEITLNFQALSTLSNEPIRFPEVPTLNDIAIAGYDGSGSWNNNQSYFEVFPRNGISTADPLKGASALDSFPSSLLAGAEVGMLKLTDFNNDKKADLAAFAVNQAFVGTYVSNSDGAAPMSLGANVLPNYVSRPDMNGCPSDATGCFPDVNMNNSGGQQNFPTSNNHYTNYDDNTMDTGDMNNDGIPDVAIVGHFSRGFTAALGSASGDLATPVLFDFRTGSDYRPRGLVLSDLDNDAILDVVMVGISATGTQVGVASWFKGNGDGTFQTGNPINNVLNGCTDPRAVATPDIDRDGRPEIAILCYSNQIVWISRRHSDGSWILQSGLTLNTSGGNMGTSLAFGRLTTSTATGVDMAVVGVDTVGNNNVRIINNIGLTVTNVVTGAFSVSGTPGPYYRLNAFAVKVHIADLNADGNGDLAISANRAMYWVGNWGIHFFTCITTGTGTCEMRGWDAGNFAPSGLVVGDVTDDGLPEIFVGGAGTGGRLIYRTITRMLNTSY